LAAFTLQARGDRNRQSRIERQHVRACLLRYSSPQQRFAAARALFNAEDQSVKVAAGAIRNWFGPYFVAGTRRIMPNAPSFTTKVAPIS
jgi:hypothetical protein